MPLLLKQTLSALLLLTLPVIEVLADDGEDDCVSLIESHEYQAAYPICRRAAEQGDAEAQFGLGFMYYDGGGVTQDKKEAIRWYRLAAKQGVVAAENYLGYMCYHGDGVAQDKSESAKWYRLAAEQGDTWAQFNLGVMYENGEGVVQNNSEAHIWFSLAAKQGDDDAQEALTRIEQELTPKQINAAKEEAAHRAATYQ